MVLCLITEVVAPSLTFAAESITFDYYKELEIPSTATQEQITQSFRTLAMKYHPDRHVGDINQKQFAEKLKRITEAYRTLKDPETRTQYDQNYGTRFKNADTSYYPGQEIAGLLKEPEGYKTKVRYQTFIKNSKNFTKNQATGMGSFLVGSVLFQMFKALESGDTMELWAAWDHLLEMNNLMGLAVFSVTSGISVTTLSFLIENLSPATMKTSVTQFLHGQGSHFFLNSYGMVVGSIAQMFFDKYMRLPEREQRLLQDREHGYWVQQRELKFRQILDKYHSKAEDVLAQIYKIENDSKMIQDILKKTNQPEMAQDILEYLDARARVVIHRDLYWKNLSEGWNKTFHMNEEELREFKYSTTRMIVASTMSGMTLTTLMQAYRSGKIWTQAAVQDRGAFIRGLSAGEKQIFTTLLKGRGFENIASAEQLQIIRKIMLSREITQKAMAVAEAAEAAPQGKATSRILKTVAGGVASAFLFLWYDNYLSKIYTVNGNVGKLPFVDNALGLKVLNKNAQESMDGFIDLSTELLAHDGYRWRVAQIPDDSKINANQKFQNDFDLSLRSFHEVFQIYREEIILAKFKEHYEMWWQKNDKAEEEFYIFERWAKWFLRGGSTKDPDFLFNGSDDSSMVEAVKSQMSDTSSPLFGAIPGKPWHKDPEQTRGSFLDEYNRFKNDLISQGVDFKTTTWNKTLQSILIKKQKERDQQMDFLRKGFEGNVFRVMDELIPPGYDGKFGKDKPASPLEDNYELEFKYFAQAFKVLYEKGRLKDASSRALYDAISALGKTNARSPLYDENLTAVLRKIQEQDLNQEAEEKLFAGNETQRSQAFTFRMAFVLNNIKKAFDSLTEKRSLILKFNRIQFNKDNILNRKLEKPEDQNVENF